MNIHILGQRKPNPTKKQAEQIMDRLNIDEVEIHGKKYKRKRNKDKIVLEITIEK